MKLKQAWTPHEKPQVFAKALDSSETTIEYSKQEILDTIEDQVSKTFNNSFNLTKKLPKKKEKKYKQIIDNSNVDSSEYLIEKPMELNNKSVNNVVPLVQVNDEVLKAGYYVSNTVIGIVSSICFALLILGFFMYRSLMVRVEILESLVDLTSLSSTH